MATAADPKQHAYDLDQVELALVTVAACNGSCSRAAAILASEHKLPVHAKTLSDWIHGKHLERYHEIAAKLSDELEEKMRASTLRTAAMAGMATEIAVDKVIEEAMSPHGLRDASRAASDMAKVHASMTDRFLTMSGRPTQINENRDYKMLLESLTRAGIIRVDPQPVIEATATEES